MDSIGKHVIGAGHVDQFAWKGTQTAPFGRHVPYVYTATRAIKGFDLAIEGSDTDGAPLKIASISCVKSGK